MSQTNQTTPSLADALSPANIANPYPLYRQMREIDPVYWDERVNSWVLTTYAHNVSALRDTRFSAAGFMAETAWIPEELRATLEPPIRALTRQMLFLDPPDHTRLRGLVAKPFTPPMIEALRPTIQQIADELLGNCVLILAAGHGTTIYLIGNGTLALLRNPDQLAQLQAHPTLISSAVPELLRYDGPVQLTSRRAKEDLYIGDKAISAGQEVIMLLGAANHDPAQFSAPDQLNLTRPENRHLAFGLGIHFCLGAPLARVEGEIAFSTLVRRFPALHLETEDVAWQPSVVFRGPKQLPIVLS